MKEEFLNATKERRGHVDDVEESGVDWRRRMQSLGGRGQRRTSSSPFLSSELSNSQNKVCYDGEEKTEKQHPYPPLEAPWSIYKTAYILRFENALPFPKSLS